LAKAERHGSPEVDGQKYTANRGKGKTASLTQQQPARSTFLNNRRRAGSAALNPSLRKDPLQRLPKGRQTCSGEIGGNA
jgi:hypothetical protein